MILAKSLGKSYLFLLMFSLIGVMLPENKFPLPSLLPHPMSIWFTSFSQGVCREQSILEIAHPANIYFDLLLLIEDCILCALISQCS